MYQSVIMIIKIKKKLLHLFLSIYFYLFLAHLSLLQMSFWDTAMSVVIRMLVIIITRSSSKLGHVGSKTRLLGQISEKSCVHSKGTVLIISS